MRALKCLALLPLLMVIKLMLNKISVKIVLFILLSIYGLSAFQVSVEGIDKFGFNIYNIIACIGSFIMMVSLPITIKFPRYSTLLLCLITGWAMLDLIIRKY
jgi:hypothetical protein